jgi:hypothetical protein
MRAGSLLGGSPFRSPRRSPVAALLCSLALTLGLTAAPLAIHAAPVEAEPVLYVQKGALWLLEPKAAARQLAALPAELGAATSLQTDPAARVILVGSDVRWYWSPLRSEAGDLGALSFRKLPCAAGRATLSPDGAAVLCATPSGTATVVQLPTLKQTFHPAPLEQTALVAAPATTQTGAAPSTAAPSTAASGAAPGGTELRLVWADPRGIWTAPVASPRAARQLAPEAPRSSFSVSPTGERGLGVYTGAAHHGKNVTERDMLFGFALDGRAVRRKAIQHARPLTWSADARWVLVQDNESACIMAATGGQYKCWKGYRGVSISRDGHFALLLGNRAEKDGKDAKDAREAKSKKSGKRSKAEKEKEARLAEAAAKAAARATAKATKDEQDAKDQAALKLPRASIELTRLAKGSSTAHTSRAPGSPGTRPGVTGIGGAHPTDIDTLIDSIESYDDEGDEPNPSGEGGGEGGEGGEAAADSTPSSSLTGELHLYRATLNGAFTLAPTQLAPSVDGAATFAGALR